MSPAPWLGIATANWCNFSEPRVDAGCLPGSGNACRSAESRMARKHILHKLT